MGKRRPGSRSSSISTVIAFLIRGTSTLTDANGDYRFNNVTDSIVTVVAEVPLGCNTIPFSPGVVRSTIGVGDLARSITQVDVDGDGDLDFIGRERWFELVGGAGQ